VEKQWDWEQKGGRMIVAQVTRISSRYDVSQEYQWSGTNPVRCESCRINADEQVE
jgi:hypothetical protein